MILALSAWYNVKQNKIYTFLIVAKREKAAWHNLIVRNYNITEVITIDFDFDCLIFTPEEGTIPDSLYLF